MRALADEGSRAFHLSGDGIPTDGVREWPRDDAGIARALVRQGLSAMFCSNKQEK